MSLNNNQNEDKNETQNQNMIKETNNINTNDNNNINLSNNININNDSIKNEQQQDNKNLLNNEKKLLSTGNNLEKKVKKENHKNIFPNMNSINIVNKNYCMWDLDNIFVVFKKNKGGLYLVYADLNSFTCYDLIDEETVIKVKNAHEYYIINFRHTYDNNLKKDLIISVSGENNNAKLWDVERWECMVDIKSNKFGIMFSACFLYDNYTGNNYIVTSNCTGSEYIKIFDLNGNKITDVPFNPKSKDDNNFNNNNYINNGNNDNNNDKSNNDENNDYNSNNYEDNNNIDENNNNSNDISYNSNDYNIIENENINDIKNDNINNVNNNKDINKEDEKNMKNDKKNYNNDKENQINKENNITNNNEKINHKNYFSSNYNNNETLNKNNNIDNNVNNINVISDNINQIINSNNNINNIQINNNHSIINDKDINTQMKQDIINDINNNTDNDSNEKIKDIQNNDECIINNDNQQIINDININDKEYKIIMKQNYKFPENNKGNDNNIIVTEINLEKNNNKKNDNFLIKEYNLNSNHIDNDYNESNIDNNIIDNNIENDIIHNDIINNNDNHLNESDNGLIEEEDNLSNDNNFNNNNDNNSHNNDNNINEFEYDNIYFVETYFDKTNNFTYIIACCSQYVKSYNYNLNILYHKYQEHEMENRIHSSAIINESGNITKLIESCIDGYLRIWNFHECILLKRIKVETGTIKGICLWDDNHILIGCDDKSIKVVDINNENTIKVLFGHQKIVCCIKTINHDKYGKCIVSKGWGDDVIKLWINNEIN